MQVDELNGAFLSPNIHPDPVSDKAGGVLTDFVNSFKSPRLTNVMPED